MTDFLTAPLKPTATDRLREGYDFTDQRQLGELLPQPPTTSPPRDKPANSTHVLAAKLTTAVLDELQMFEYTGVLPGGSWSVQPAWRIELWQTYWQAQLSARH